MRAIAAAARSELVIPVPAPVTGADKMRTKRGIAAQQLPVGLLKAHLRAQVADVIGNAALDETVEDRIVETPPPLVDNTLRDLKTLVFRILRRRVLARCRQVGRRLASIRHVVFRNREFGTHIVRSHRRKRRTARHERKHPSADNHKPRCTIIHSSLPFNQSISVNWVSFIISNCSRAVKVRP